MSGRLDKGRAVFRHSTATVPQLSLFCCSDPGTFWYIWTSATWRRYTLSILGLLSFGILVADVLDITFHVSLMSRLMYIFSYVHALSEFYEVDII